MTTDLIVIRRGFIRPRVLAVHTILIITVRASVDGVNHMCALLPPPRALVLAVGWGKG